MERYINQLYRFLIKHIPPKATVLDLGCGDGALLEMLVKEKKVKGTGIDISGPDLNKALSKGLSVLQADLDKGLQDYKSKSFDYVVLSSTLQVLHKPALVVNEMLRVGKNAIVVFPNFGHWWIRLTLLLAGRMPKSRVLPYEWFNTPNIHLLTMKDFKVFCSKRNIRIIRSECFNSWSIRVPNFLANLLASNCLFIIKK
jgi:methionine biosynthesis protein MetW